MDELFVPFLVTEDQFVAYEDTESLRVKVSSSLLVLPKESADVSFTYQKLLTSVLLL